MCYKLFCNGIDNALQSHSPRISASRQVGRAGGPPDLPTGRENKKYHTRHKYNVQYTNISHSTEIHHTMIVKSEKKMLKKSGAKVAKRLLQSRGFVFWIAAKRQSKKHTRGVKLMIFPNKQYDKTKFKITSPRCGNANKYLNSYMNDMLM